jgi:DNA-binding response OmpR family regulator
MEVLIIDDDPDDCMIIKDVLQDLASGIFCKVLESGEEAIRYLRQSVTIPDIIFLDIEMAGMDGKETLLKIKSMKAYSRSRIIMYSGRSVENEKIIYLKLGASGFINKGISINQLRVELEKIIGPVMS